MVAKASRNEAKFLPYDAVRAVLWARRRYNALASSTSRFNSGSFQGLEMYL